MMRTITKLAVAAALTSLLSASVCSPTDVEVPKVPKVPSQAEIDDAKSRIETSVAALDQARVALETLGILPTYTCGESRGSFVAEALNQVAVDLPCVTATGSTVDADHDAVALAFPEAGCQVDGHTLKGRLVFTYSGGQDRFDAEADFRELLFDGAPVPAKAGYGTCGDQKKYWALAQGSLSGRAGLTFRIDGAVAVRDGMPVIGGTTLILDGTGSLISSAGTDRATFTALEYELGEYLPKSGTLAIETSSGHAVAATFTTTLWVLGKAEITVDGSEPVTVPIVR